MKRETNNQRSASSAGIYLLLSLTWAMCLLTNPLAAQEIPQADSVAAPADAPLPMDSLAAPADSTLAVKDSVSLYAGESDFETTVHYQSRDSMRFDVRRQMLYLYGEAQITYGDKELSAGQVRIEMLTNSVTAKGIPDTTNGTLNELAVFVDGGQEYQADSMKYNFKTGKGIISNAVTQQGEGFLKIDSAKKMQSGAVYGKGGRYTTCNLADPHFAIYTNKVKAMPEKYVVSGPFNLEVNSIPTPLGFIFGIFPAPNEKVSGIIVPTYGEQRDRGFFLRDGGFYWAISDYIDMQVLGQIYTLGGWGLTMQSKYKKRYAYNGGFSFRYNKVVFERDNLEKDITNEFWVEWSHRPISRGAGKFSANVNLGTRTFNQTSGRSPQNYLSPSFSSSITYANSLPNTPFSMGITIRQNQNAQTGFTSVTPQANLTMKRIFPFRGKGSTKKNFLTQLGFNYTLNTQTKITNAPQSRYNFPFPFEAPPRREDTIQFNLDNVAQMVDEMAFGVRHSIPVSTTINILKHFQIPFNFSYQEIWYPKRLAFELQGDNNRRVGEDTLALVRFDEGFHRTSEFSGGFGVNTRMYIFYYMKSKKIEAIRHQVTPSLNFTYRPDFGNPRYGAYDQFLMKGEIQGRDTIYQYTQSRFQGSDFVYGGPGRGESGAISFSLGNQLEMKTRVYSDSSDESETRKLNLIRNLSISSSYNMIADSFNLAPIRINAATTLFEKININGGATIDPYTYSEDQFDDEGTLTERGRRTPILAWQGGQGVGRLTSANFALSTSFKPPGSRTEQKEDDPELTEQERREIEFINANPDLYVDFNVPWTLSLDYNFNYRRTGNNPSNIRQTVNFSGDFSLTEKWKFGFSSGYDFDQGDFSFSSLNIFRDLHCWQMSLNWIPFGPMQSYSIDIRAKSALLQDLKVSKRNQWFDRL